MKKSYYILIDSSSDVLICGLAKIDGENFELIDNRDMLAKNRANQEITESIKSMFEKNMIDANLIAGVICGRGPGSYTGVRIGLNTAKGIASALRIPLYGLSSLDIVAWTVWSKGIRGELLVMFDASMKRIFPGLYGLSSKRVKRQFGNDTQIEAQTYADDFNNHVTPNNLTKVAGDGLYKYEDLFSKGDVLPDSIWRPTSQGMLLAFVDALQKAEDTFEMVGDPALVLPFYSRLSNAEEDERRRRSEKKKTRRLARWIDEQDKSSQIQLQPIAIDDVDQVEKLDKKLASQGSAGWTAASYANELKLDESVWWGAYVKNQIIGFAGARVIGSNAEILNVAVDEKFQGETLATRLIERVTYDCSQLGASTSTLEVRADNKAARGLYEKLGYTQISVRKDYYRNPSKKEKPVDAIIYKTNIPLTLEHKGRDIKNTLTGAIRDYPPIIQERSNKDIEKIKNASPLILSVETSCDETAMAVIDGTGTVLSNVIATQIDFHTRFGGVVPEIASRKHTEAIVGVYEEALKRAGDTLGVGTLIAQDLSGVGVTKGPGLEGSLVIGLAFAKGVAVAANIPVMGVNHLEGHLYANLFETPDLKPPFIASLLSGGHTMLVLVKDWGVYEKLGETLDDAIGEAFDKVAKALDYGYPGGPIITELAKKGDPCAIKFPRAMMHSKDYRFSLSGLKTAVVTYIQDTKKEGSELNVYDVAASFQAAAIEVQVKKAVHACQEYGVKDYCAGGGVAANPVLRDSLVEEMEKIGVRVTLPPLSACTDNAAMISLVALKKYKNKEFDDLTLDASARLDLAPESL